MTETAETSLLFLREQKRPLVSRALHTKAEVSPHGVGPTHRPVGHLRAVIVTSESGVPVLAALSLRTRRSRRATAGFAFTFGVAHTRVTLFLGELRDAGAFLRADLTDTYGEGDSAIAWAILTFALSVRPTLCAIGKGSTVVAPGIHG